MRLKFLSLGVFLFCGFLFCAPAFPAPAAASEAPSVRSVDFYPGGARFLFQAEPAKAGETGETGKNFEFTIPGAFDLNSVRFLNRDDVAFAKVESVPSEEWTPPALLELKSEIDGKDHGLNLLKSRQAALSQTITRINSPLPKDFGGRELLLYIDDSRSMLIRIGEEMVALNLEIEKAEKALKALRSEYESKMPDNAAALLRITAASRTGSPLQFEAFTYSAGWSALHDMNLDSATGRIDAKTRARVWQKTGVDAAGDFTFHTRQPFFAIVPPDVRPLTVSLRERYEASNSAEYVAMDMLPAPTMEAKLYEAAGAMPAAPRQPSVISALTDVSVAVGRGELKGDGATEDVELARFEMKSVPVLVSVPAQNREAWIIASMDSVPESLLPGIAELAVDGKMTGRSDLPDFGDAQTRLPFGMAPRMTAKRSRLVSKTGSSWLGLGKGALEDGYTLEITNSMETARKITVKDRIPVPINDKISLEVTKIDPAPSEHDKDNRLTWDITVEPGSTAKITVEYRLRYPDGETLEYR